MYTLVLIRHGESILNAKNLFTGWEDTDLSEKGILEAKRTGDVLRSNQFTFDIAFTSYLKRASKTLEIILNEMKLNIPIHSSWRLNERHYGSFEGLNKDEVRKQYGEHQFEIWHRGYDVAPPPVSLDDSRYPGNDVKYKDVPKEELPQSESLKDVEARFMHYWIDAIVQEIKKNKRILIVAHNNTLRALIKNLDKISNEDIPSLSIITGVPLVYELDETLTPIRHFYLGENI
ncbi:MAG: 2,3-diphosphoglycerate-dependent phosphoglycerate mutase [Patescibacteria group bacterium]